VEGCGYGYGGVRSGDFGGGWVEDLSDAGIDGEGGYFAPLFDQLSLYFRAPPRPIRIC
jgi:hypothetical protein